MNDEESPQIIEARATGRSLDAQHHTVGVSVDVEVACECGNTVVVGTMQRSVICQGCGTEWRLR